MAIRDAKVRLKDELEAVERRKRDVLDESGTQQRVIAAGRILCSQ